MWAVGADGVDGGGEVVWGVGEDDVFAGDAFAGFDDAGVGDGEGVDGVGGGVWW
ncbi:Uncharacterised protein [Dermatophilus congolensis]|uniref:Uncharacterized protein n=1 Tax=Dermatophilus congolensis TaxID=1863 RepID=A0AA46BLC5_9MICO|nr:Uncharacterised protein [Dermatophilus congolensis]